MNCTNCGAAMELAGGRHYFFCTHCGSFGFPDEIDDGVKVLERDKGNAECGVCRRPLVTAALDEGEAVHYCENCRGVLLSCAHFAAFVDRQRAWANSPPVAPMPLDRKALSRSILCPNCRETMSTHPYYGPGNVVIDTCVRCDLVWLDFGELQQIVDAPGQDRGRRERSARSGGDDVDLFAILAGRVAHDDRED